MPNAPRLCPDGGAALVADPASSRTRPAGARAARAAAAGQPRSRPRSTRAQPPATSSSSCTGAAAGCPQRGQSPAPRLRPGGVGTDAPCRGARAATPGPAAPRRCAERAGRAAARQRRVARRRQRSLHLDLRQLRPPGDRRGVHLGRRRARAIAQVVPLHGLPRRGGERRLAPPTREDIERARSDRRHRGECRAAAPLSRRPIPTTPCPTSCWTSTRPGRWWPSRASSSASSRTCGPSRSRRRCGWRSSTSCCRRAASTATPAAWPPCASAPAASGRPEIGSGASATRGCSSRRAAAWCAPSCSGLREPATGHIQARVGDRPRHAPGRHRQRRRAAGECGLAGGRTAPADRPTGPARPA